jgi:hypothetical protein
MGAASDDSSPYITPLRVIRDRLRRNQVPFREHDRNQIQTQRIEVENRSARAEYRFNATVREHIWTHTLPSGPP